MPRKYARVNLPDLNSSIKDIVDAESAVRSEVTWHNDIYDSVTRAIGVYIGKERKEKGSGNDADFQKELYGCVHRAIMGLLHDTEKAPDGLAKFRRDITKYRSTMDARLAYVGALVVAAAVSTKELFLVAADADETQDPEKGDKLGFSNKDVAKWNRAADLVSKACQSYAQNGVKKAGPDVQGKIDEAFTLIDPLRQKAFKTYNEDIPLNGE